MKTNADSFLSRLYRPVGDDLLAFGGIIMLSHLVPLVASYLDFDWLMYWFFPFFAGYIVISVPGIIRALTSWR